MPSNQLVSALGLFLLPTIAYIFSEKKSVINWPLCIKAFFLQCILGCFMLKTTIGALCFNRLAKLFDALYSYAHVGSLFVFGSLADSSAPWGVIFALKIAPIIIFFGAFIALLSHWGIIRLFLTFFSYILKPLLPLSKAETLSLSAGLVLGQTETPLLVKDYLPNMSRAQLLTLMVSCMAHLSSAVIAVYGSMGISTFHLLASSVMALPGSVLIAKLLLPDDQGLTHFSDLEKKRSQELILQKKSVFEVITVGTIEGLSLATTVLALLIAFMSLMAFLNALISAVTPFSLDQIIGFLFYPIAFIVGIDLQDCSIAGQLIGKKLVLNEFMAYSDLLREQLSPRTVTMLTYALAGFSNFSCIGIQVGGISTLCLARRGELAQLGLKALLGGTLVNLINTALVGLLLP